MTIVSPATVGVTYINDNVSGDILPADVRVGFDSAAGIFTTTTTSTPYVLALTDRGTCIEMNLAGANVVNVPTNASVAFDVGTVINICQIGNGQTSVVAVTPATTNIWVPAAGAATTRAQWATITLRKRATDEWVLSGDLT